MTLQLLAAGDLDTFGTNHGTDKCGRRHDYLRFYEFYLKAFREMEFTLLELGVGPPHNMGKSLLMWKDYFPNAQIVGVDINPEALAIAEDRIAIEIGNLGDVNFLGYLAEKYQPLVLVDDASHQWAHQILALETLFRTVLPGGIFIVEDLNTSFGELTEKYGRGQFVDGFEYVSALATLVGGELGSHSSFERIRPTPMQMAIARETDAISIYRHTAILMKKARSKKKG